MRGRFEIGLPGRAGDVSLLSDVAGVTGETIGQPEREHHFGDAGYSPDAGNSYAKQHPAGTMSVDILVPFGTPGKTETIGGRGFDAAPGLSLAMNCKPLQVHVAVTLTDRDHTLLEFAVPVPDIEAALILKALAWDHRHADKDLVDVITLLELVDHHRPTPPRWKLQQPTLTGTRRDAAAVLHRIVDRFDRGTTPSVNNPARAAALIRRHISRQ